jgi:glucokinase
VRAGGREPAGVGLGFGGPVDYVRQVTRQSFHSPGWSDIPLAGVFASRLDIPALLDNDANAGGLAEALFGAGRGRHTVLYVNVGTGIGGAIVIDGSVHHGATTSAGEIGHVLLDPAGPLCNCGKRGCLEALASGSGLERAARDAGLTLTGREVMAAAESGDATCLRVVAGAAGALGLAIANAVSLVDPDIVVLGGGVPEAGQVWWRPLRESFGTYVVSQAQGTPLARAELGYRAGVLGAAALGMKAAERESPPG